MFGTYATDMISGNSAQGRVAKAIQNASVETGVDFDYLMQQAKVESGLNPSAKAKTSSATGLYQFIEQTWLRMVKAHGTEHGYGRYADAIKQKSNGDLTVSNGRMRNEILNLRHDARASSLMAAELATENHDYLQQKTGITPGKTDLYMAHFLGAGGAANFIRSMQKNPWAPAASFFPEAARSNRGVFYAQGRPLSLQQVYNNFRARFQDDGSAMPVIETAKSETYTFVRNRGGINLPDANDWSKPGARIVTRFSGQNRMAGGTTYYQQASYTPPVQVTAAARTIPSIPSGFLSAPVDVTLMASRMYKHDDESRYNA